MAADRPTPQTGWTKHNCEFREWYDYLRGYAEGEGHPENDPLFADNNAACWREYFDSGCTPEDAYREDCSNA